MRLYCHGWMIEYWVWICIMLGYVSDTRMEIIKNMTDSSVGTLATEWILGRR